MRRLMVALIVGLAAVSASTMAQEKAPATSEECLKIAFDLAKAAESKTLSNDDLDKVEQLLNKMEGHCDAGQFADAASVAGEVKVVIAKP